MKTTDKVRDFKKALQTRCNVNGILVIEHWGSRRSKNIMKLVSGSAVQKTIRSLYVKDRSSDESDEGFWGLTEHQIDGLQSQGHQWDVVLLVGSGERGYLGTSQQVAEGRQGHRKWSFSKAGDYKVHEREIEGWFTRFETYDALFPLLLPPTTQN
jgi:hypothetical protein